MRILDAEAVVEVIRDKDGKIMDLKLIANEEITIEIDEGSND